MATLDLRKRLGETIRQFRLASCLTPQEFGDDIGKSQYFVLQLEDGQVDADLSTLEKCAGVLHIEISELFEAASIGAVPLLLVSENETQEANS